MTPLDTHSLQIFALLPLLVHGGPWCFKCDDTFHPAACQEVIACGQHEYCHTEKHSNNNGAVTFSSGCKPIGDCTTVVKRSTAVQCSECCPTTLCNEVTCHSESISNKTRLWCASCDLQSDPAACDHVKLCSQDEVCSVLKKSVFGHETYDLGCEKEAQCKGLTLATNNQQCCDQHLCNTNSALVSPDDYTSPPPSTTTPSPAPATSAINQTDIDFVSKHQPNETLTITCLVGGFPTPNVTWIFTPGSGASNGTSGNATTAGNATAAAAAVGNSTMGNSTAGNNVTAVGNSTSGNSTAPAATSMEITSGVTTSGGVSTLVITSPDSGDAGEYVCRVENSFGPDESAVTVTFAAAPIIAGGSNETVQAKARDDVILDCDVDGVPPPDVEWLYPPTAGGVEKLSNGSLLIHNTHADNSGDYLCMANNTVGKAVKSFALDVDDNSTAPCPTARVMTTTAGLLTTIPVPTSTTTTATTSTTAASSTTATSQTTATTAPTTTPAICPTLPSTTTAASTVSTTAPTTPTTSTTSATTASTTTPPTTSSTPPTTSPTSVSATTTTTATTASPSITTVGELWHNTEKGTSILHCSAPVVPGSTSAPPITWSRLENDYDHSDTATYTEDGHGILVVTRQPQSTATCGVYQCHVAGTPANETAEFVVYKEVPGPIDCRQDFQMGQPSPGLVLRTTCGNCQTAPYLTSSLVWRDMICENAVGRKVIPPAGGIVTWLLRNNNEVALLKEENGHVVLVT